MLFNAFNAAPAEVVLFTDGAAPDPRRDVDQDAPVPRLGWVAFIRPREGRAEEVLFSSFAIPEAIMNEWTPRVTQVAMVELFGAVAALEAVGPRVRGATCLLLVDAEAAQGALVKGYSAIDDFGDLLGCFWKTAMEHELAVYVDRVPTDSNVSDGPSRSRFQELEQRGAKWLTTAPSPCLSSRAVFWEEVVGRSDMTRSTVSAVCTGTSPSSGSTSSSPGKGNWP